MLAFHIIMVYNSACVACDDV